MKKTSWREELPVPLVHSRKTAGYRKLAGRSRRNGPFSYLLCADYATGAGDAPNMCLSNA